MIMSLGRLLVAGKSLVGLNGGTGRYQVSKRALLPKFISPKNPFESDESSAASPEAAAMAPQPGDPGPTPVEARADASRPGKESLRSLTGVRAVGWLGGWGQKLNPLARRTQLPDPVKSSGRQGELSLATVRVVRNDLSDADVAGVRPTARSIPIVVDTVVCLASAQFAFTQCFSQRFSRKNPKTACEQVQTRSSFEAA